MVSESYLNWFLSVGGWYLYSKTVNKEEFKLIFTLNASLICNFSPNVSSINNTIYIYVTQSVRVSFDLIK